MQFIDCIATIGIFRDAQVKRRERILKNLYRYKLFPIA